MLTLEHKTYLKERTRRLICNFTSGRENIVVGPVSH